MHLPQRPATLSGLLCLSLLAACQHTPLPKMVDNLNATLVEDPFAVRPGDRVAVQFPNNPEWNHVAKVRPDGTANFQFVGRLDLVNLNLEEVEAKVIEAYEETLAVPDLAVDIPDIARRSVLVVGTIRSPGPVSFADQELSLVDVLAQSGGPEWREGNLGKVVLFRWFPEERKRVAFKLNCNLRYWGYPDQIWMQPDDILWIPPKNVAVLGNWVDQYIRRLIPIPYSIPTNFLFQ